METRFVFPLTVATALHAFVFFGVKWTHPTLADVIQDSIVRDLGPLPIPVALQPPEDETTERDMPAPTAKGDPTAFTPQLEDVATARVAVFEQAVQPNRPGPITISHTIPRLPFGDPGGDEVGALPDVGVEWASGLDNPPRTRSQVGPAYPAAERNAGITGEVLVEFMVDESGRVFNPRVVRSSNAAFEPATLRAVAKWRFEPGKKNGRAVRFRMMVPVTFNLGGV